MNTPEALLENVIGHFKEMRRKEDLLKTEGEASKKKIGELEKERAELTEALRKVCPLLHLAVLVMRQSLA